MTRTPGVHSNITITTTSTTMPATDYRTPPRTTQSWSLVRRWRTGRTILLVVFTVFWNTVTTFVTFGMFAKGMDEVRRAFPLPGTHIFAGVVLAYVTAAMIINTTRVEIDEDQVSVKHTPVPWRRDFAMPLAEITDIGIEQCGCLSHSPRHAVRMNGMGDRTVAAWVHRDEADYIAARLSERLGAST